MLAQWEHATWNLIVFHQYEYFRFRRCQACYHRCDHRTELSTELSRDRCNRQTPATARRSHNALYVVTRAVRSRQRMYNDAYRRCRVLANVSNSSRQLPTSSPDPGVLLGLVQSRVYEQPQLGDGDQNGRHNKTASL